MEDWLRNPWVIGGGILAVLAVWYLSSTSSSSASSGQASYAQANLDLVAQQAQINGQIEAAQINAGTANTATIAQTIGNLVNAKYSHDLGAAQVAAGIHSTDVNAATSKYLEDDQVKINAKAVDGALLTARSTNNANAYIAMQQAGAATTIAHYQAAAATQNSQNGLISNIAQGIFGLLGGAVP